MTPPLTLPGDIPGLLRRCSPVIVYDTVATVVGSDTRPAALRAGEWLCSPTDEWTDVGVDDVRSCPAADLALDLTNATGRAHAAWWLAARFVPAHPFTLVAPHVWVLDARCKNPRCVGFTIGALAVWASRQPPNTGLLRGGVVPSLADLDPDDPRVLPDGSRWVDAEALRRVCLHVAGRSA